ncbi:small integral membrane protein 19 isoform X1 [Xiphophorus maculatus]|uniref:small integral membrane protein 19 isoform X1 n=1 Tax=Xiphophorus maculatus TaxID=8083 RepID=UPI0006D91F51|nr:small integral membrane protein 19 isoform X1 [Xiphophorus maculatus]
MGGRGLLGNQPDSIDYSVHEAWNEATNVYLLVILVSFGLLIYARKNKRKIMRIFTLPPTVGSSPEPNFYDSLQKLGSSNSSSSSRLTVCSSPWNEKRRFQPLLMSSSLPDGGGLGLLSGSEMVRSGHSWMDDWTLAESEGISSACRGESTNKRGRARRI